MHLFNNIVNKLLESNTAGGVLGATDNMPYADKDTRPFEPARIVLGAKTKKRKNKKEPTQQMVPVQRRPRVESIFLKNK